MKRPSATRVPRGRRGTAASITALVGLIGSAVIATEAISWAARSRTIGYRAADLATFGRDTRLGDRVVLIVAVVAVALGLVLILAALVPARRRLIELTEPDPHVAVGLERRSLRRTLAAVALGVDGVTDAEVTGRRGLKVTAGTSLRNTESLPDRITERVTARLAALNPAVPRRVRVVLDRKDG